MSLLAPETRNCLSRFWLGDLEVGPPFEGGEYRAEKRVNALDGVKAERVTSSDRRCLIAPMLSNCLAIDGDPPDDAGVSVPATRLSYVGLRRPKNRQSITPVRTPQAANGMKTAQTSVLFAREEYSKVDEGKTARINGS